MQVKDFFPLSNLNCIHQILPVKDALVIGAGMGRGMWFELFEEHTHGTILLVEAEQVNVEQLEKKYSARKNWSIKQLVVAEKKKETVFNRLSNCLESSLLSQEEIGFLWPNITTKEKYRCLSVTVDELLLENGLHPTWMIIDCLPAYKLLEGAKAALPELNVIIVRMIVDNSAKVNMYEEKDKIVAHLQDNNFRLYGIEKDRHPSLGYAVYVKDMSAVIEKMNNAERERERLMAKKNELSFIQNQGLMNAHWEIDLAQKEIEKLIIELRLSQEKIAALNCENEAIRKDMDLSKKSFSEQLVLSRKELEAIKKSQNDLLEDNKVRNEDVEVFKKKLAGKIEECSALKANEVKYRQKINDFDKDIKKLNKELDLIRKDNAQMSLCVEKYEKDRALKKDRFGHVRELIDDMAPFFYGKSLTYVDVGAYNGDFFKVLSECKKIKVREAHLYEPNKESYDALLENVKGSSVKALYSDNYAIGDENASRMMIPDASMTRIVDHSAYDEFDDKLFAAKVRTLDALSKRYTEKKIHLLKIDVEGYEMNVLRGAKKLLGEERIDAIYVEVGYNKDACQQTYFADVDAFLQQFGYRVFKIYEQIGEWMEDLPFLRRCNYLYMSRSFGGSKSYKLLREVYRLRKRVGK